MFFTISLKQWKSKWQFWVKLAVVLLLILYVIPKIVLAISGMSPPPANQKLRDDPIRETPMKVERERDLRKV
jgi:hypothetical protein